MLHEAWKDHYSILGHAASEVNTKIACMLHEGAMNLIPVFTMSHHSALAEGGGRIKFVFRDQKPLAGILGFHLLCGEQRFLGHDDRLLASMSRVASPHLSCKGKTE